MFSHCIIKKQTGFTLVEIIVVIAILGIVGGLASLIIGRTLDAYSDVTRREQLQASVRLAVERIAREIRHALPNSICVHDGTGCVTTAQNRFYFIPVKDSGRYQDKPGTYTAPPPIQRHRLAISPQASDRFDVLSTNNANRLNVAINDYVAVYNLNNNDVYAGINNIRHRIGNIIQKDINNTVTVDDDIDQIQLTGGAQSFASHSPTRRFHIIDNTNQVTLFYRNGSSLFRETTSFAAPNTTTAASRLLLENIQTCNFTYTPGSQQRAGLLNIDITVTSQGEQIRVIHNAHVFNTP